MKSYLKKFLNFTFTKFPLKTCQNCLYCILCNKNIMYKEKYYDGGNHDHKSYSWYYEHGWDFVCESTTMKLYGKQILFTHVPVQQIEGIDLNIHGHLHGDKSRHNAEGIYNSKFNYDVAPDIHGYGAVDVETII